MNYDAWKHRDPFPIGQVPLTLEGKKVYLNTFIERWELFSNIPVPQEILLACRSHGSETVL